MTFLNAALLGGLAAAGIPILIHLFHRSRFKVVPWGAMHLLESVLRRNRRRIRLEQLILLLVRCSIPCFLALLMARPVVTGMRELLGDRKTSTVILLDNSYSMEAGGPVRSNFHAAKECAVQIIDHLVPGSEIHVVKMAGGVSGLLDEPSFDAERVKSELMAARAGFGSASVPEALRFAAASFSQKSFVNRDVVVLSDFQRVSWDEAEALERAKALDHLLRSKIPPALTLFQVGREVPDNLCVESLETSRMILGVGQKLQVRANLVNHGETDFTDVRVVFRADGVERSVSQISVGAGQRNQVLFSHAFDTAGSHVIEVFAEADPLQADNAMMMSIPVWSRVPVLLVSGDPNPEPLRGETDFLEIALRPYSSAKAELADLIATRAAEPREFGPALLADARVVVLANVPQLAEPQLRALEEFVRDGGGLLVFPGNRINSAWYNSALHAEGRGLLPMSVVSLAGTTLSDAGSYATVVSQNYEHPALELFNDPRNGNLSETQVWLWYRLRGDGSSAAGGPAAASVLARLDSGDPFLVEKPFGEGRVMQCCIPCDADWSNLPMRPFYLPLMQQLTTYLASKVFPPRNVEVGKPLVAFLPPSDVDKKAVLTDPDGKVHELKVGRKGPRGVVEFAKTQVPGLYTLDAPGSNRIHFVVNTDRRESDLRRLSAAEIDRVAKAMGAKVVRSWNEYRRYDQERRFGQEIWMPLLALVVLLLFAELALEQMFARRKA